MNSCEKYQELISCLVDGVIAEDEKKELMEHIAVCPECAELLKIYTEISAATDGDAEPPEALLSGVMEGVRKINAEKSAPKKKAKITFLRWAAAAACFALVCFVGVRSLHMGKSADMAATEACFDDAKYAVRTEESAPAEKSEEGFGDRGAPDAPVESRFGGMTMNSFAAPSAGGCAAPGSIVCEEPAPESCEEAEIVEKGIQPDESKEEEVSVSEVNLYGSDSDPVYGKYREVFRIEVEYDLMSALPHGGLVSVTLEDGTSGIEFPAETGTDIEKLLGKDGIAYRIDVYSGSSDVSLFVCE